MAMDSKNFFIGTTLRCLKRAKGNYYLAHMDYYRKNLNGTGVGDKDIIVSYYDQYIQSVKALEHNINFIKTLSNFDGDLESLTQIKFTPNSKFTTSKSHFILDENNIDKYFISSLKDSMDCANFILKVVKENNLSIKKYIKARNPEYDFDREYSTHSLNHTEYLAQAEDLIEKMQNKKVNFNNLKKSLCFVPPITSSIISI